MSSTIGPVGGVRESPEELKNFVISDPVRRTAASYTADAQVMHENRSGAREDWTPSYEAMARLLPEGGRVLDLGCGSGPDEPGLTSRGMRPVGLDISAELLRLAYNQPNLAGLLCRGDLRTLPFRGGSFDGVWADGSLHHVPKRELRGVLREIWRVLRPGGAFMASAELGDEEGFQKARDVVRDPLWYSHYRPRELRGFLAAQGLVVAEQILGKPSKHSKAGFISLFARRR